MHGHLLQSFGISIGNRESIAITYNSNSSTKNTHLVDLLLLRNLSYHWPSVMLIKFPINCTNMLYVKARAYLFWIKLYECIGPQRLESVCVSPSLWTITILDQSTSSTMTWVCDFDVKSCFFVHLAGFQLSIAVTTTTAGTNITLDSNTWNNYLAHNKRFV